MSVEDITTLSDAQLDQLMERHRHPNGDFEIAVDGWNKLENEARGQLAERLQRAQERVLAQNPIAHSRPLDLDQLNARLAEVSDNNKTQGSEPKENQGTGTPAPLSDGVAECSREPTEPLGEEVDLAFLRDLETDAYHKLVNDGGRPLYPISLLVQVSRDPDKYREMLRPFWGYPRDHDVSWLVFHRQSNRWQDFRNWQKDNRGLEYEDDGYTAFAAKSKRDWQRRGAAEQLAKIEADSECLGSERERRKGRSMSQREPDCHGFSDYEDAMKRCLARHGFARPPFQLHEDPMQQDPLTTWIEYLCFEYWWLDRHTESIERLKLDHDKRWQELVDLKLLKPHENAELVRTNGFVMKCDREIKWTREAKKVAESERERVHTMTQEDPDRPSIPESTRTRMLRAATKKLGAMTEQYEFAERRGDELVTFLRATFGFEHAKKDAAHQKTLLQWVLEQFPLIDPKLQLTENETEPHTTRRKRSASFGDASLEQSHKKQKPDQGELGFRASSMAAPIQGPTATPDDQPGSREEAQGSPTPESPARRVMRSAHERGADKLGTERNTQRSKGPEEELSAADHERAADHQRRAGKRRRGSLAAPVDEASMVRSKNGFHAEPPTGAGIQGVQTADACSKAGKQRLPKAQLGEEARSSLHDEDRMANRSCKKRKLKHRELNSPSDSRPVQAEGGEDLTGPNSAMEQTGIQGPGTDTASDKPRRSTRIAAHEATAGPVSYFPRPRAKLAKSPKSLSVGGQSGRGPNVPKNKGTTKGKRSSQKRRG